MKTYVPLNVPDEGSVFLEIDTGDELELTSAATSILHERLETAFSGAMSTIQTLATGIAKGMQTLEKQVMPSEYSVEFGVSFSAEVGAVVSKATSDATMKVTVKWSKTHASGAKAE